MSAIYKSINNYEEISTCYHEAGHVIFALLCFCKVSKAELLAPDEGAVYYEVPEYWTTNNKTKQLSLIRKQVGIKYAGLLTEQILYENLHGKSKIPLNLKAGSSCDFKDVTDLLSKYNVKTPGIQRKKYKNKIKAKVTKELKTNWNAVSLVANLLLINKELNYNKIKKVLSKDSKKWNLIFQKIENS
jgi:hypothetical protein